MNTLADRWRAYCGRRCLDLDALTYGVALIESAGDQMRERAARLCEDVAIVRSDVSALQAGVIAGVIRSLTSD